MIKLIYNWYYSYYNYSLYIVKNTTLNLFKSLDKTIKNIFLLKKKNKEKIILSFTERKKKP